MNPLETHEIIFEVVKMAVLGAVGWLLKMHTDVKTLRKEMDAAFCKIRALEISGAKDPKP